MVAQRGAKGRVEIYLMYYLLLRALISIFLRHIPNLCTYHFIWSLGAWENMEQRTLNGVGELYCSQ